MSAVKKVVVHKVAVGTVEFIEKKISDEVVEPKLLLVEDWINVEDAVTPIEERINIKRVEGSIIK